MTTPEQIAQAIKKKLPVITEQADGLHITQNDRKMILKRLSTKTSSANTVH